MYWGSLQYKITFSRRQKILKMFLHLNKWNSFFLERNVLNSSSCLSDEINPQIIIYKFLKCKILINLLKLSGHHKWFTNPWAHPASTAILASLNFHDQNISNSLAGSCKELLLVASSVVILQLPELWLCLAFLTLCWETGWSASKCALLCRKPTCFCPHPVPLEHFYIDVTVQWWTS